MTESPRLAAHSIDFHRQGKWILKSAYVDAIPGKVTGLVGRSGAGKTTLLDILVGQRQPNAGGLTWNGKPIRLSPTAMGRCRIGYLPSCPWLPTTRSAREILALASATWKSEWRMVADEVGLNRWIDLPVGSLATGQRRLTEMAILLACEAETLILDEPFRSLDPLERELISRLLRSRAHKGVAILFADHDSGMTLATADRMFGIQAGQTRLVPSFREEPVSEWYR